jgi:DnaJ-class molecular chaperone
MVIRGWCRGSDDASQESEMSEIKVVKCSVCYGGGRRKGQPCPACKGTGKIVVPK